MTVSGAAPSAGLAPGGGAADPAAPGMLGFDVHGVVAVGLADADERDAAAVARQLGRTPTQLRRDPDVVIRFVDSLATSGPVRYLGVDDVGFTDDAFLVLRGRHKRRIRVSLPVADIGERPTIVCERGAPGIPFLTPILNVTALANGALPLHASAFVHEGKGVVATGWSKGGKTETLLAFGANGARYVGDEWVYLTDGGARVHGLAEPVRVWKWHLRELPGYRGAVARSDRARLATLTGALSVERAVRRAAPGPARRARYLLEQQQHVDVEPERLFGAGRCDASAPVDTVLFVVSRELPGVAVEPADPDDVARRMAASLEFERLPLLSLYLKWKFAFPGGECRLLERAPSLERSALSDALGGKPAYTVQHPYPVSLRELYAAVEPYCR